MGFYDSVKQTADVAGEKINRVSDIVRAKIEIADAQGTIKRLYQSLGKAVYLNEDEDKISALCDRLDIKIKELEGLEAKLADLKGNKECENCGKRNSKDAKYCDNCGSTL